MSSNNEIDYDKPVAYDNEGRPLYAHPPSFLQGQSKSGRNFLKPKVSEEAAWQHDKSVKSYPMLNLSENEYVVREIRRNLIGLLPAIGLGGLIILGIVFGLVNYPMFVPSGNPPVSSLFIPAILLIVLVALVTYITVVVYTSNKFFLTNESVIQESQTTLFARNEHTLGLSNIEDVSYTTTGILPTMFGYGTIKLSTEGERTNYIFKYVSNPKQEVDTINNTLEKFDRGKKTSDD